MKYRNKKKAQRTQVIIAEEGFHLESVQPTTHAQGGEGQPHAQHTYVHISFLLNGDVLSLPQICTSDVECLMSRLQHTFKQEMTGVGASLEKRWKFCGFEGLKLT